MSVSVVRVVLQLILVGLASFGISTVMEWYKKKVRKDKASTWEVRGVAAVLSIVAAIAFRFSGFFTPVISAIWSSVTVWVDVALYAVVIFFLQYEADMKWLKAIIKVATDKFLADSAVTEEIKKMLNEFETTTGMDTKEIVSALKSVGITEDNVKGVLEAIGMSAEKVEVLVAAFKEAIEA